MECIEVGMGEAKAHESQRVRFRMGFSNGLRGLPLEEIDCGAEVTAIIVEKMGIPDDFAAQAEPLTVLGQRVRMRLRFESDLVAIKRKRAVQVRAVHVDMHDGNR